MARRSQGNPFYVEQLVGHLESGEASLPEWLRDALLASLAELPAEAVRALDVLALGVGGISHDVLSEVAGIPGNDLDRVLRAAVERRLVQVAGGMYAIGHALLQEALASRLLPGESLRAPRDARTSARDERRKRQPARSPLGGRWGTRACLLGRSRGRQGGLGGLRIP